MGQNGGQYGDNMVEAFLTLAESGLLKNRTSGSREESEEEDHSLHKGEALFTPYRLWHGEVSGNRILNTPVS